jgi:type I restriction enzyme S subunit
VGRVLIIDDRAVAEAPRPLICSNFCRKLRLKPGADPFFVKRQLDWLYHSGHTDRFQTSTTNIRNLQVDDFVSGTQVVLPDSQEQGQLTALLDAVDEKSTSGSAHIAAARRAVGRLRGAILAAACSGRLTAEWRETQSPGLTAEAFLAELLASRDTHRPRSAKAPPAEALFDSPESWVWSELRLIAELKGGIQKGAKLKPGEPTRELPYLRVANVQRGWLDLDEIKTISVPRSRIESLLLKTNDVLFTEGGDRDKLGRGWIWEGQITNCVHQNHVFRARLSDARLQPKFYSWFGNSLGAKYFTDEGKQTVNLASLSMSKLGDLPVPLPPPDEQVEIVRLVDKLMSLAARLEGRVDAAANRLDRTSQAVLAKAFRGELEADITGAADRG